MNCSRCHVVAFATTGVTVGILVWIAQVEPSRELDEYPDRKLKHSDHAVETAAKLRLSIDAEVDGASDREWAGEYFKGAGFCGGVSLHIAPETGFAFEASCCLGVYDRNYGAVEFRQRTLRLAFEFLHTTRGLLGVEEELIPVSWGDRWYLIPPAEMIEFCNSVNDCSEPRTDIRGAHLLRLGDEGKAVCVFPDVPDEFRPYLLEAPIEMRVIKTGSPTSRPGDSKVEGILVEMDAGSADGVLPGMRLHAIAPTEARGSVTVAAVEESRCFGVFSLLLDDGEPPAVGWKLSTRARWSEFVASAR